MRRAAGQVSGVLGSFLLGITAHSSAQVVLPVPPGLVVANAPAPPALASPAPLPDGPGAHATPAAELPAILAVTGAVTDKNGNGVKGAEITLLPGAQAGTVVPPAWKGTTDAEGLYTMHDIQPGTYRVQVVAFGFREEALKVELHPSRQHETVPTVVLQLAETRADVEVTVTTEQIAQQQLHEQLQQRALAIFPNFYTSYVWGAAPLNARQKFELAAHSKFDPVAFATIAVGAGLETGAHRFKGYGDGPTGFGKRYAAEFTTSTSGRFLGSAVFPSLFHQDPRYFFDGHGSVRSRLLYAVTRPVVARSDAGTWQPNYSLIAGRLTAAALANAYLPASDRSLHVTLSTAGLGIAAEAGADLVREFILKRITSKVPSYANGRPEDPPKATPAQP